MNHWIRPSCASRTGAAHLRRGLPCQDASGVLGFCDADGTPIQVLVVSDGHGGARYVRSDVGARLACDVAMRELQQTLALARVAHPGAFEEWRRWLAEELPKRIVQAWRREVEDHWRGEPAADGSAFSPVLYGATLGVLLLTPVWWAHTGLGDWDLVRIDAAGGEALLSEEPEREAGGEATFSLCLERAERHFAGRSALLALSAESPPFALLLCSDGLRKSCGSDADFLTLSRYLVGLSANDEPPEGSELSDALDHISQHGSGDDISVAVARWAPARQSDPWPQPGEPLPARWLQPLPVLAPPAPGPLEAGPAASPLPEPSTSTHSAGSGPGRMLAMLVALLALGGAGLLIAAFLVFGPFSRRSQAPSLVLTSQQRSDLQRQVAVLCGPPAALGSGQAGGTTASVTLPQGRGPAGGPAPSPRPAEGPALASAAAVVAGTALPNSGAKPNGVPTFSGSMASGSMAAPRSFDPRRQQRISATLAARASVFQRLERGDRAAIVAVLRQSHADPLSALIAYSASDPALRPELLPADSRDGLSSFARRAAGLLPFALRPGGMAAAPASPLVGLQVCPELSQALRAAWQRHGSRASAVPAATATPAAAAASGQAQGVPLAPAPAFPPATPAASEPSSLAPGKPSR